MNRREAITVLSGAAVGWPLAVRAQQPDRIRRVGALLAYAEKDGQDAAAAFGHGLERLGWVEGRNIHVDFRFAAGDPTLYRNYAAELVSQSPAVILASASPAAVALQTLTRTIPIVFVLVVDPIGLGLVRSLNRPGGNITGFSDYDAQLMGKWLSLLKEIDPSVVHIAVIFNPDTAPFAWLFNKAIETAAQPLGMTVTLAPIHDDAAIEEAVSAQAHLPRVRGSPLPAARARTRMPYSSTNCSVPT
jgi:putative tryptophan/tyrosine transport system substrate-binding protein